MVIKRFDIEQTINVLEEVLGSRESVTITILEILHADPNITEEQRLEILRGILAYQQQNQQQEEQEVEEVEAEDLEELI
jgi:hypothetical protein